MRFLKFFGFENARKGEPKENGSRGAAVGTTRHERPKLQSQDSNPDEPPKRLRKVSEDYGSTLEDQEDPDVPVELLSEYDKETARAVEVLQKFQFPVDPTCLVPRRPSNVGSWDWKFPSNVRSVSLSDSSLGNEVATALATVLKPRKNESGSWSYPRSIKALLLSNARIGTAGAEALAQMLEPQVTADGQWTYNDGLEKLDLSDNAIGDEGALALACALMPRQARDGDWCLNKTLHELWMGGIGISADGLQELLGALFPVNGSFPASRIEVLGLGQNALGDHGAEVLAKSLSPTQQSDGTWVYSNSLRSINAWGNRITDQGGLCLLEAFRPRKNADGSLAFNTAMQTITMFRNHISEECKAKMQDIVKEVNDCRGEAHPSMVLMC